MKIILRDIGKKLLLKAEKELKQAGNEDISVLINIAKFEDLERLARFDKILKTYED
jgi:hypothetical protein